MFSPIFWFNNRRFMAITEFKTLTSRLRTAVITLGQYKEKFILNFSNALRRNARHVNSLIIFIVKNVKNPIDWVSIKEKTRRTTANGERSQTHICREKNVNFVFLFRITQVP